MLVEDLIAFLSTKNPKAPVLFVNEGNQFLVAKQVVPYPNLPEEDRAQAAALGIDLPLPAMKVRDETRGTMYLGAPLETDQFLKFVCKMGSLTMEFSCEQDVVMLTGKVFHKEEAPQSATP
ncbi:hypothetical protein [Ramlibacter alkalitolerans]|nr:hypothetical protein [Ramlibacter alkalitolerans]